MKYPKKIFYLLVILPVVFVFSFLFLYGKPLLTNAFAPPPASNLFLLVDSTPDISKNICSQAVESSTGSFCHPAGDFDGSFPVNRGEELTIKIKYQPPTTIDEDEKYPQLKEIKEILPAGYFSYVDHDFVLESGDDHFDSSGSRLPEVGEVINNSNNQLVYKFSNYRPEGSVELRIRLKAEVYTSEGAIKIDRDGSYVRYDDVDRPLPPENVEITDIKGPIGDIYSHGEIDNSGDVLGTELNKIDVIAAENSITNVGNEPAWEINNYQLKASDDTYRDEDYYDFYRAKINKRVELLKQETNPQTGPPHFDNNPFYHRVGNLNLNTRNISFPDNKTILVDGDIVIEDCNIENFGNGVAFVSTDGNIILRNTTNNQKVLEAHFIALDGEVVIDNQTNDGHLIVVGSLSSKSFRLIGNKRVTYRYNSIGLNVLPGIAGLYNPQPYEHYN
jgi:hypothetical protein